MLASILLHFFLLHTPPFASLFEISDHSIIAFSTRHTNTFKTVNTHPLWIGSLSKTENIKTDGPRKKREDLVKEGTARWGTKQSVADCWKNLNPSYMGHGSDENSDCIVLPLWWFSIYTFKRIKNYVFLHPFFCALTWPEHAERRFWSVFVTLILPFCALNSTPPQLHKKRSRGEQSVVRIKNVLMKRIAQNLVK